MPPRPDVFSAPDHAEGEFFSDAAESAVKVGRRRNLGDRHGVLTEPGCG